MQGHGLRLLLLPVGHRLAAAHLAEPQGDRGRGRPASSTRRTPTEGAEASPQEAEAGFESDEPAAGGEIVTGFAGGDTRFQVLARLYSTVRHIGVTLKADLDDVAPSIESWIPEYPGADWCERETWEMYGFDFVGHPNLIHLYLPGEFEGFPLRKDFPLLAREVKPWPGLVDVEQFPATYKGDD